MDFSYAPEFFFHNPGCLRSAVKNPTRQISDIIFLSVCERIYFLNFEEKLLGCYGFSFLYYLIYCVENSTVEKTYLRNQLKKIHICFFVTYFKFICFQTYEKNISVIFHLLNKHWIGTDIHGYIVLLTVNEVQWTSSCSAQWRLLDTPMAVSMSVEARLFGKYESG